MKQFQSIALSGLTALLLTACGGGGSSDVAFAPTPTQAPTSSPTPVPTPVPETGKTVEVIDYFWEELYTDDEEGNFHQTRYEKSTAITEVDPDPFDNIFTFYISIQENPDGTMFLFDSRFPVEAQSFLFPNPTELEVTYTPTDDSTDYDVTVVKEDNKIAIVYRLYDAGELHVRAEYYLEEKLGLYKTIFNGETLGD